jgi:hypothetical protein
VSPNPLTAAAAWTTAVIVDVVAVVVVGGLLAWDRWCPADAPLCPTSDERPGRNALLLAVLGAVLALVALVALVTGRFLLAVAQVALIVVLAVLAAQALPVAWAHLRDRQVGWTAATMRSTT